MKLKFLVSTIVSIMIWPASIMAQSELIPMIEIPAGNFYMGTLGEDENYDEAPMHKVHISKPFKMGLTEVSQSLTALPALPKGEPLAKPITLHGLPKPLPLGEVALRSNDGEGRSLFNSYARSTRWR